MGFLHSFLLLLSAGVVAAATVMGMAATDQMAAKRKISLEYQNHMEQCQNLSDDAARICEQQAQGHAEVAKAALATQRKTRRPV